MYIYASARSDGFLEYLNGNLFDKSNNDEIENRSKYPTRQSLQILCYTYNYEPTPNVGNDFKYELLSYLMFTVG